MPLETSYHVVCDICRNYAGYYPKDSFISAVQDAQKLGWWTEMTESKQTPGIPLLQAHCPNCQDVR